MPQPARRSVLLALAIAVGVAALLQVGGVLQRPQTALHDLQARIFAPRAPITNVLVIDIDEASVAALRPRFGGWPPNRELLALVAGYLLDVGARAVAIDLVLDEPRDGDAALARVMAAQPRRIVLAAAALPAAAARPAGPASPGCPMHHWPALLLPAPALRVPPSVIGMVSMPTDADGMLRSLPLWQTGPAQALPSLPLATWQAVNATDAAAWHCTDGAVTGPGLHLSIDADGRVRPRLPARADAVPMLPLAAFATAALGAHDDAAQRDAVRGRVVFIGASAGLGDAVQTPLGPRSAATWLAASYAALDSGQLDQPPRLALDALGWLLACVPALVAFRRAALRPAADLGWAGAGLAAIVLLDAGAYGWRSQQSNLLAPWIGLLLFAALSHVAWQRGLLAAQARLERARDVAEATNRLKSEFLAHMSHELRTPMNALLGAAEMLDRTALDARQQRHVALFQSAGVSLMDILNDLLDLSKIEAGLLELHPRPFSLVELVADQSVMFEARAAQKGLRLLTHFDPDLPPVVYGDAQRLAQVLRNLVGNAVKFTHEGSVTLAVHRVAGTASRLRFEVRDTGVGIAAARLEAIFSPFTQADSGVARAYGGTGLGLTISRRLVALMEGAIDVDSVEGEGAVFHIELELPASRDAPVADWVHSVPITQTGPLRPLTILLADDNPHNVFLVQVYLEDEGHHIDVVHEGRAAVDRMATTPYDVVLMDVQMPGMDGYRATEAMRAIERERHSAPVPVIALTANALPDDEARSLAAGCTAHLSKPFSRAQLRSVLARHADTRSAWTWLERLEGFDLPAALARMDGHTEIYLRVLQAAVPALAGWSERFAAASARADRAAAHRLAHDLKSTAATLGAVDLAAAARALEDALRPADGTTEAFHGPVIRGLRTETEARLAPVLAALASMRVDGPAQPPRWQTPR